MLEHQEAVPHSDFVGKYALNPAWTLAPREQVAENSVCKELERQRTKELTELAQNISYGDIHSGVSMTIHRMSEVDDELKEQYWEISGDLLHISRQLQKSVLQQLQDSRCGGKQTGLLMGRRLDTHALSRNDGRVFYKNALPNETPVLSVGLLLDESGSMCGCDRDTYARATAIILYDFCQTLNIPIMVYGHSTGAGADLYSYAEFDAIDRDDRYRMMDISARSSNRDGAALRYVAERLAHRPEDVKLLMLVSDGQPADTGYFGTAAEEDLRGVKQEYQRKGILFVAAAIGNDKENIGRIYGDSFLDISDLTKLPIKLAGTINQWNSRKNTAIRRSPRNGVKIPAFPRGCARLSPNWTGPSVRRSGATWMARNRKRSRLSTPPWIRSDTFIWWQILLGVVPPVCGKTGMAKH